MHNHPTAKQGIPMSFETEPAQQPERTMNRIQLASCDAQLKQAVEAHLRAIGVYMENPVPHNLGRLNVAISTLQLAQLELQFKYQLSANEDNLALDLCEERLLLAEF